MTINKLDAYRGAILDLNPGEQDIVIKQMNRLRTALSFRNTDGKSPIGPASALELIAKLAIFCYQNDIGVEEPPEDE